MALRAWQRQAREAYHLADARDWLCEATPGAGKTRWALSIGRDWLTSGRLARLVVVCPTTHLRRQWAEAAAQMGLALDPDPANGREGPDFQGVVLTYQQVAANPTRFAEFAQARPTGVIFDEIHHAGDGLSWGEALRQAFDGAVRRLALSGTPFRSDEARIPFVRYRPDGASEPDFRYTYDTALRDGVCRPLYFPAYGGVVAWRRAAGPIRTASFQDDLSASRQHDRLRAAVLSPEWLAAVLAAAHRTLLTARQSDPTAGGLVVASSQAHARAITNQLYTLTGEHPALAISDDPAASATLHDFAQSSHPWLVAVNMVSEGVDIPRLRVGVYATTVTTELYFRQVAGRLVRRRRQDDPQTAAWLYLPGDPTLLRYARGIQAARRTVQQELAANVSPAHSPSRTAASTFTSLGGLAWAHDVIAPAGVTGGLSPATRAEPLPLCDQRARLRTRHHRLVGAIARRWGLAHRMIHAELSRLTGSRIEEASMAQLERRLAVLEQWLETGGPG